MPPLSVKLPPECWMLKVPGSTGLPRYRLVEGSNGTLVVRLTLPLEASIRALDWPLAWALTMGVSVWALGTNWV